MSSKEVITINVNPVFGALTRNAMTAGVTFEYHGLNLVFSVCTFIVLGNILYGFVFIPIHLFGWLVCRHDVAFFTIVYKRLLYLPPAPNKAYWGVRSYDPF